MRNEGVSITATWETSALALVQSQTIGLGAAFGGLRTHPQTGFCLTVPQESPGA